MMKRLFRGAPVIAGITALTALVGLVQFVHPSLVTSWRRDTSALRAGEWWRAVTPMFVQGDGAFQYAFNLVGSALIGPSVERRYGSRAVLLFYSAGGLAGIALEYIARPNSHGSGSSDAVAALIGALWWSVLMRRSRVTAPTAIYASYFAVSLLALRFGGPIGSTLVGAALAAGASTIVRRQGSAALTRLMAIAVPVPALILVALRDSHGAGLLVGVLLGASFVHRQTSVTPAHGAALPAL